VSKEEDCERMADAAVDTFGRLDVAVASAGFGYEPMPLLDRPLSEWRKMLDVVLSGVMLTDRAAARRMASGGAIVNIASMAAYAAGVGGGHYEAAKAGVLVVTKTLAQELAPGIRVNAIAPGWTVYRERREADKAFYRTVARGIPLRRVGSPRDVANAALFLAGEDASYITGECVCVDGGQHASTRF
jgi:NAD(P)-dependent dehydrogenase (short-subunit alcohol dehydrogenase family)